MRLNNSGVIISKSGRPSLKKKRQIESFKNSNHELKQEVIGAKRNLKSIEKLHLEKEIEYKTTIEELKYTIAALNQTNSATKIISAEHKTEKVQKENFK